jgi:hypothetical protein
LKVLEAKKVKGANKLINIINNVPGKDNGTKWVWIAASVFALLMLIITFIKMRAAAIRRKELKNIVIKKSPVQEEALKISVYPFQRARDSLTAEDHKRFYSALQQSLWTELSSGLQLPLTRLNRNTVIAALRQRGKDATIIIEFELLADECELALYTPVYTSGNRQEALGRAERILAAIRVTTIS